MSESSSDEANQEPDDNRALPSLREVVRFLETVTGDSCCQACGSDDFSLGTDKHTPDSPGIVKLEVGRVGPRRIIMPAIPVVCNKCGWLRMHAEAIVSDWLDANPKGEV